MSGSIRVAGLVLLAVASGLAYSPIADFIAVTITALARAVNP
jgi:hypothetical protein